MRISLALIVLAAVACSREAPPRDYQNNPPAMTHAPTSSAQSPSVNGMPAAAPEPTTGAEGKNVGRKPESPVPPRTLTMKDQPPVTDSQHATQTTSTAATGTHLAAPP